MSEPNAESGVPGLTGGEMPWKDAADGPLSGATCLWQDLDGLHIEPAPPDAPCTSILWGWRDGELIRVRLDGPLAFVAVLSLAVADGAIRETAVAWDPADGRIASRRGPAVGAGTFPGTFEQITLHGAGTRGGPGAITFLRPAPGGTR